jgi:hypothetical protein
MQYRRPEVVEAVVWALEVTANNLKTRGLAAKAVAAERLRGRGVERTTGRRGPPESGGRIWWR